MIEVVAQDQDDKKIEVWTMDFSVSAVKSGPSFC